MIKHLRMASLLLLALILSLHARAQSQTVTNGAATTTVNFTGTGCRYNWTNNNPGIGLAASGTGDIASFTAVNTGTTPIIATITATPVAAGYAYIPNGVDNTVSVVDLSTKTVKAKIPVGQTPVGEAITPDGSKVYITNSATHSVSVISTASNTVTAIIPLVDFTTGIGYIKSDFDYVPVAGRPEGIAVSPDGKKVYVANSGIAYTINILDNSNNIIGKTDVYIVYVIDTTTGDVGMLSLGRNPTGLCFNRDGTLLYVSDFNSNVISVVDVKQANPVRPLVISGRGNPIINAGIATVVGNIAEPTDHSNVTNPGVTSPYIMALTPDGSRLYVTNVNYGTVTAINTATNTIIATINVGQFPGGICISPDGSKVYVASSGSNSVAVISTATNSVIQTYYSFDSPSALSLSPDGKLLYINNASISDLTVSDANGTSSSREYIDLGGAAFSNGGQLGNFIAPGSCAGSAVTFTITVNPTPPTISTFGTISALNTIYGTASASTQFYVSGVKMTAGILVTSPNGFEVSIDNVRFSNTVIVGAAGTIAQTPVYVRQAATSAAGNYSGNILLSSQGANNVSAGTVAGTIIPANLIITANHQSKTYGADNPVLTLGYTGFVNGDDNTKLTSQAIATTTATAASPVGSYPITVAGALGTNYNISYVNGTLTIIAAPAPVIASVAPLTAATGTAVTITGSNLLAATAVSFGGTAARSFTINSATSITAVVGTGASGNISVTTPGGTGALSGFTFIAAPVIASFNPASAKSGVSVTITGTGFSNATAVSFGGTPAQSFSVNSATVITAVVGAGASGNISVTTPGGTSGLAGFVFIPAPVITSISTNTAASGGSVIITGTGFSGATVVSFGGTPAASFTVNSSTSITAVVGTGASGNVAVTTPGGTVTFGGFNFVPMPVISASGPLNFISGGSVILTASPATGYSYQWLKDGAAISGATSASYTASQSGSYSVVALTITGVQQVSAAITVNVTFGLPASNFKITNTGCTCKGSSNGTIGITAAQTLNYTVTITGNGINSTYPFTASTSIGNLAPGTYNVCLTVAGQSAYQQCFTSVITEPKDLALYSVIVKNTDQVVLSLNGATTYNVKLNDVTYSTNNNQLTLTLKNGVNTIVVSSNLPCQGQITESIITANRLVPFPNPFIDNINVNVGIETVKNAMITIYDTNNQTVYSNTYKNVSGVLQLDVSKLNLGLFFLKLSADGKETIFKMIKR